MPTISIVMPCFNAREHLPRSVGSVLAQSFRHWELIAIDDGSVDGTRAWLDAQRDPCISVYSQPNSGVCAARNAGLERARGDFVAFLDADDTWEPDCLAVLHETLVVSSAAIAYCGWQNIGLPGGRGQPYVPPQIQGPDKLRTLFDNCQWPIHACLARRAEVLAAGGFDPRFKTSEDYLLWLKIGKDKPIARVPRVLANYHFHGGQATRNKAAVAINHFRAQSAFLAEFPADAARIAPVARRASMQGRLAQRGLECHWNGDADNAHAIFRALLRTGHVELRYWKYTLAALLPRGTYARLLGRHCGAAG